MHLIREQRNFPDGSGPLPEVLPPNLIPPSMRAPGQFAGPCMFTAPSLIVDYSLTRTQPHLSLPHHLFPRHPPSRPHKTCSNWIFRLRPHRQAQHPHLLRTRAHLVLLIQMYLEYQTGRQFRPMPRVLSLNPRCQCPKDPQISSGQAVPLCHPLTLASR